MLCETLGCLPNPGALLDQHPSHIARLERIYSARNKYEKDKLDKERPSQEREDNLRRKAAQVGYSTEDIELL